ncbi:Uncharacterized protein family UPF0150 domain protein, partial [mine drainage metagenome]
MKYTIILELQEEGGYTVTVPALPGCISEGDTKEEAIENIKDAISGYIESLQKAWRNHSCGGICGSTNRCLNFLSFP